MKSKKRERKNRKDILRGANKFISGIIFLTVAFAIFILTAILIFSSFVFAQNLTPPDNPSDQPPENGSAVNETPDSGGNVPGGNPDDGTSNNDGTSGGGGSSRKRVGESCSATSQCRTNLCCVVGGSYNRTCQTPTNLSGGACMGATQTPPQQNNYVPPAQDNEPLTPIRIINDIIETAKARPVLAIILTLVAIGLIALIIFFIIFYFRKRR